MSEAKEETVWFLDVKSNSDIENYLLSVVERTFDELKFKGYKFEN